VFLFYAYNQEKLAIESQSQASESVKGVFELNVLTNDYLLNQGERARVQWYQKYDSCARVFEKMKALSGSEEEKIQMRIMQNHHDLKSNFDELVKISSESDKQNNVTVVLRSRLVGNIFIGSQNIVTDAFRLSNLLDAKISQLRLRVYYAEFLIVVFLFILILVLIFVFYNNIIHPIIHLNLGVTEIAAGNYGYKIPVKGNDEVSHLAKMFNEMSDAIKNSRLELEHETKAVAEKQNELEEQKEAVLNVLEDVEEEKAKSDLLASELEKFKLAVKGASDHIVITDPEGKIVDANIAAEEITGYTTDEMLGKTPALWGKQMSVEFYKKMWHIIKEEKKIFSGEIVNQRKGGYKYTAAVSIVPILDTKKKILFFVGIERNITKEKEVDRSKTEFVSLVSHQLRTPLTAISWYAEMLQSKGAKKLSAEERKYLDRVYQSNRRMINLVNALLNVSRIELGTFSVEPTMLNLVELANSILNELSPLVIEKNIKLQKKYGRGVPTKIKADGQLVRIIIQNLLSNSIKYTPNGGEVVFSLEKNKKDIKIIVSDNGYGIPKSQQNRIFTKLFRADNIKVKDTDGTGLGLYLVKLILDSVGGKIWFESEENKGSTFHVLLPLAGMKAKPGTRRLEFGEKIS
jgi:PAS domain S-box-containing protein